MKTALPTRKLIVILLVFLTTSSSVLAANEPIPSGSFIINMGVVPQTYSNGLKPWGLVYDLIKNYKVQVKWVINPAKTKDGIDFTYGGTDFKGGTFIILQKYRTAAVDARIAFWQGQGVVGITTNSAFTVDVTSTLKYTPRWTFDFQNGSIALNYLVNAGIPTAQYPKKDPDQLNDCDDLFIMPHADPTWDTHKNLLYWNRDTRGWLWYGCHAGSVIEDLENPLNAAEKMNFLTTTGLVNFSDHHNPSTPFSYRYPADPEMQFMGTVDNAVNNGSEQVYLPKLGGSWRPGAHISVWDPSNQDVPSLSPGDGAIIAYGRAFDDITRGKVMFQAGHNFDKNNADAVAAQRAFFNFSFSSVVDKEIVGTVTGPISIVPRGTYTYTLTLPVGLNPSNYTYHWTASCGGVFSNPFATTTNYTAGTFNTCSNCTIMVTITDGCGREYYQTVDINSICPIPPVALDRTSAMITNPPGTGAQPIISAIPLAGTDSDGYVVNYVIKSLPAHGTLYYDNDNNPATADIAISSLPGGELVLTNTQMKSIKYDPVDAFGGNDSFTYTVTDNSGLRDLTPATYTIPLNPPPQTNTFICTPVYTDADLTPVCPLQATDNGTIVSYTILTIPAPSQCTVYLYGVPVTVNQVLTPIQSALLKFKPTGTYIGYAEITYTAMDDNGAVDATPATLTLQMVNQPPVAIDQSAPTIANPVGAVLINIPALTATDADGSIVSYTITNIPSPSKGILYYNNSGIYTAATDNLVLTVAQAGSLKFDPVDNFTGVATFKFTATDNGGLTDNTPATYSVPVKSILPIANNITNPNIYAGAGLTAIHVLTGSDPDSTNIITAFIINQLPNPVKGTLYYNNGTTYVPVIAGAELTPAQGTTLKYAPAPPYTGNSIFKYTVKDDEGFTDPTAATFTIPLVNQPPSVNNINSAQIKDTSGRVTISPLSGTDPDGSIVGYIITTIPDPSTGILTLGGNPITPGQQISVANGSVLQFDPVLHNDADAKFKYTAIDNLGLIDPTSGNYTIPISFVNYKKAPVADPVANPSINMKNEHKVILPLMGHDTDGVVKLYQVPHLSPNTEGVLYLQGIPVSNNQYISADKVDKLTFVPSGTFKGTTNFKFKNYDNDGLSSGEADFNIPVVNSHPVAKNKTADQIKKGTTTKLAPLEASDSDGVVASIKVLSLPALGTLQYDSAGNNTYVNVVVNRTMTPAQAQDMRIIAGNTLGTTTFTFTAKDNINDTSAIATYSIPIGSNAANQKPFVSNITTTAMGMAAVITAISPITATDLDGTISSYTILSVPPPYYGMLFYNSSGSVYDSITIGNFTITPAQAATLKFVPSGIYAGDVSFRFTATDDNGEASVTPGVYTIPIVNADPVVNNITNASIASNAGPVIISALTGTDDGMIDHFIITDLPDSSEGILVLDGSPVDLDQEIPVMYANRLEFDPNPAFSGTTSFKYSAADNFGSVDITPATFTIPVTNQLPVADDKLSQVITNSLGTGAKAIPALTGVDNDGSITGFFIQTLPNGGILYKNGTAINSIPVGGYAVNNPQAGQLTFDPNDNFSGVASFTYTVKDNNNNLSTAAATYQIPVNVPPITSNVNAAAMAASQGTTALPGLIGSDDGAVAFYSILSLPDPMDGTLFLNNIPVTNLSQVDTLTLVQATQLSFQPSAVFDGAIFTYTTTDNLGVIDVTPAVYSIPYFNPAVLPIDLLSFSGIKSGTDNLLKWSTSQEINSDHFELEHSTDGVNFVKIATVNAKGNSSVRSDYSFTDIKVAGGIHYYRLKMIDKDNAFKYSSIVTLKRDGANSLLSSVSPNPFIDKIMITIQSENSIDTKFAIYDMNGRLITTMNKRLVKGINQVQMDKLANFGGGMYMLQIKNDDIEISTKLMKAN